MNTYKKLGFCLLLLLVALFCLAPLMWQLLISLKPASQITRLPPLLPQTITGKHYVSIFTQHPFAGIILNSIIVAGCTTALSMLFGTTAAFALAKLKLKAKIVILGFILSISMIPPIATVSPLYLVIRAIGLRDSVWALILTYTTFSLPLCIWVLTNFFKAIPDELYLAARVDGCTPFQAFYKIMLPLAAPGVFATAILVFIFCWNEFLFALTFTTTTASRTIPVGIALFPGLHEMPWGDIAAASVVVIMPLVILILVFQRRIVAGLTAGAIKG